MCLQELEFSGPLKFILHNILDEKPHFFFFLHHRLLLQTMYVQIWGENKYYLHICLALFVEESGLQACCQHSKCLADISGTGCPSAARDMFGSGALMLLTPVAALQCQKGNTHPSIHELGTVKTSVMNNITNSIKNAGFSSVHNHIRSTREKMQWEVTVKLLPRKGTVTTMTRLFQHTDMPVKPAVFWLLLLCYHLFLLFSP